MEGVATLEGDARVATALPTSCRRCCGCPEDGEWDRSGQLRGEPPLQSKQLLAPRKKSLRRRLPRGSWSSLNAADCHSATCRRCVSSHRHNRASNFQAACYQRCSANFLSAGYPSEFGHRRHMVRTQTSKVKRESRHLLKSQVLTPLQGEDDGHLHGEREWRKTSLSARVQRCA